MKIILNGACGRMGREVKTLLKNSGMHEIVAEVDKMAAENNVYTDIDDFSGKADMIIDFSNHLGTKKLLEYAVKNEIPAVIATTGHTDEETELIKKAAEKIPVFHSANMSLGVVLLVNLAVKTAEVMTNADIEIVEMHHNRKLDAPSGTALMIANALKKVRSDAKFKLGRSGTAKRETNEIGIHAIRCGNTVGMHEVIVSTDTQTITLKHEAHSRSLFAEGAVDAAEFLFGKNAGLYDMNSIISGE